MAAHRCSRAAFTLIELLVVIGIIGVLIGLLLSAIQGVRHAAAQAQCQNNLKQLGIGFHLDHDAQEKLPPGIGFYPGEVGDTYGTGLFHLLPLIDEKNRYEQARISGFSRALFNGVSSQPVKTFQCPADPTMNNGVGIDSEGSAWGGSTYAGNAQVFARVDDTNWAVLHPQGNCRFASITDGLSNTILMAEKYARCSNNDIPEGGNFWAYDITGLGVLPLHPAFAVSWGGNSVGPGSVFVVQLRPKECNPTLTSTPHKTMQVICADGSGRSLSRDISGSLWWSLCTPRGKEVQN